MSNVENYPYSCPISETLSRELQSVSNSIVRAINNYPKDSPEALLLTYSSRFFKNAGNEGAGLEYLPQMNTDQALIMLSPWVWLKPVPNEDLSFTWGKAIAEDQEFRWNKPWDSQSIRKCEVKVFSTPLLMQVPIVFAEVASESKFAGHSVNLQWHVITPEMLAFSSHEVKPDEDWYNHPEKVLRKNWIHFTDRDDLLRFMSDGENPDEPQG